MRVRRNAGSSKRLVAALTVAAMLAAGCGGGDDDTDTASDDAGSSSSDQDGGDTNDAADETEATDDSADDDPNDEPADAPSVDAPAPGTATVTIGDTTFVADQQVVCVQIGEAIGGSWNDAAGEISISIDLPPQDWETSPDGWTAPSVRIDDDRDASTPAQFQANPEMASMLSIDEAGSMVTTWAVDGSSASGTGVFVEFFSSMAALGSGEDAPAPMEGTFSLTCE